MTKISSLSALTGAGVDTAADLVPVVDMSETGAARNKKMTFDEFLLAHKEGIQDLVAALVVAGTNVTITYSDATPSLTFDVTAPVSGDISDLNEAIDDRVAALLVAGSGISKSYNDGAGTLTLTATAPTGGMVLAGTIDCSANPNYPAAVKGESYLVSVAGKIGGASGTSVDAGDLAVALADNAGGTQASVGSSWFVLEHDIVGPLLAANNLSDVANTATAKTNLGLGTGDSPQFAGINVGHASDTTLTRTGAGDIAVEGNAIYRAAGTDVPVADGGTGSSTASGARSNLSAASTSQTGEQISGFIAAPSNKSYTIALDMKHGGTIAEVTTKSASGTCTATWKINSTALGGTANSVSSSETTQSHASSNVFAAGDDIVLTVSSNSSCADMSFTIKYTRTLA